MYRCDSWTIKKDEKWKIDALNCGAGEDFWESLDFKEIKPINTKRNQPWIFTRRTDTEAEPPILWPPDAKNGLTGKDPKAGKDWKQEEKGTTEDEMAGWHHRINGHEFEQALGVGDGQGSLGMLQSVGSQESEMTELKLEREKSLIRVWFFETPWTVA